MGRILCSQSIIEEVLQFSFSTPIFPFHFSKRFLWSHSNSLSLFSSNSFRDLFSLTSRQCIRSLCITYSFTYSTRMVFPMPIFYVKSCAQQKCRVHSLINFYLHSLFIWRN